MFSNLRNFSKIIIIIVAIAMVATGALMSFSFLQQTTSNRTPNNRTSAKNIAEVNGTNITEQQYFNVLRTQSEQVDKLTPSQEIPFKHNVLNAIIEHELVMQKAEEMGIEPNVTDQDVEEQIDEILSSNEMTEEEFVKYLSDNGNNLSQVKQQIRASLEEQSLIDQVQEETYNDVSVSEEEIINKYEKVELQVIIKNYSDDKDTARNSIEQALKELNDNKDFVEVANEYSDAKRVSLGMIGHDNNSLPADIISRGFEMEVDEHSEIIEGQNAFYIINILSKKLAEGEEYQNSKEEIKNSILQEKQDEAYSNWLASVKENSQIKINDPVLKGYNALSNNDYETAVSQLEQGVESYPTPMTYVFLAQGYNGDGQTQEAQETFEKALEKYPDDWEVYYNYAVMMTDMEEVDKERAIGLLDKAASLSEDEFMVNYQLYSAYSQLGATEKAQEQINKISEIQMGTGSSPESTENTDTDSSNDNE
ncbi:MAG: SurA N-terminal domain-containing protein [Bacillota bacterium]